MKFDPRALQTKELFEMPLVEFELSRASFALSLWKKPHVKIIFTEALFVPASSKKIVTAYRADQKINSHSSDLTVLKLGMYLKNINSKTGLDNELLTRINGKNKKEKPVFVDLSKIPFTYYGFFKKLNKQFLQIQKLERELKMNITKSPILNTKQYNKKIYWNSYFRIYCALVTNMVFGRNLKELKQRLINVFDDSNTTHDFLIKYSAVMREIPDPLFSKYVLDRFKLLPEQCFLESEKEQRTEFQDWANGQ